MHEPPTAAIVAIGTEITEGRIVNTNGARVARRLLEIGVETTLHAAAPDERGRMARPLRFAAAEADAVIVTGGLGPTIDDITRDVAADVVGAPLEEDAASLAWIEAIFASLGRAMTANNRRQALFPRGAAVLPNGRGTAPGFRLAIGKADCFFLPGVPHEMEAMLEAHVVPALEARFPGRAALRVRRLNCFGLPESKVDALLSPLFPGPDPELAFNVSDAVVQIYLTVRGGAVEEADRRLDAAAATVREALGACVFGEGRLEMEDVLARALLDRNLTIAFAESCTAGGAAARLARVPGISAALRGGIVAYANDSKTRLLGVDAGLIEAHGAVSREVAEAMARGAWEALGADVAVAVTGVAGPGGGSAEKPVGTVHVASLGPGPSRARHRALRLPGDRERIQRIAALTALDMARRAVMGIAE